MGLPPGNSILTPFRKVFNKNLTLIVNFDIIMGIAIDLFGNQGYAGRREIFSSGWDDFPQESCRISKGGGTA